jgi:gluconolactonase
MDRIVSQGRDIEELGRGYNIAEGPVWDPNDGSLLFSDVRNNMTMRWTEQDGVSVSRESTNEGNGLTWDPQGRLVICEGSARRMTRLESDGAITVVADNYEGTRLNRPNDVVVKSDGSIYFTDPGAPDPALDMDFCGVYRVSPDLGTTTLLVRDFVLPNGLCFSPDESILYVNDSVGVSRREDNMFLSVGHIRVFDVSADGSLANGRVFSELRADRSGIPDGMKVDVEGNVYCTGPGGVWVMDSSGNHLGTILTGSEQTTNCAWGGDDWKTFFITTFDGLYSIQLNIAGVPVPTS